MSRISDPKKALVGSIGRLADKKIAAAVPGKVRVSSINPDGTVVVEDGKGGCLTTIPPQNVSPGDYIPLADTVGLGETISATPIYSTAPPSTVGCPSGEMCDLAPGGAAPDAPAGLMLTVASETEIDLSWMADACAASFNIDRASGDCDTNSGFSRIATGVTDVTYADTGLTADTTYAYRVTAVGANGSESEMSDCASATTDAPSVPTLFTSADAWDLTTGALSSASHPSALSDAYGYKTIAGSPNAFWVGPQPGYATLKIGDDAGGAGFQGYGSRAVPSGFAAGRYQLGKGPSTGIVAGLEFVMPLTLETPNTETARYKIVLTLRDATTFTLIASNDLSDIITYMQANDGAGQMFDQGGIRAHLADFVPQAGVVPDPDGSFWIITNSGNLTFAGLPLRIFKRSPVDGSAVSHVDLAAGNLPWGTDPGQITLA